MKPQRRKEKILGYNSVPSSATAIVQLGHVGNGFGTAAAAAAAAPPSFSSSGLPTSGAPARAKPEKQSYNACPPPPGLYDPPPPSAAGASYAERAKASPAAAAAVVSLCGNSSDTDKKGRRRPGRKKRQVSDSCDLSASSGKLDSRIAAGLGSQESQKDVAVPSRVSASSLSPAPSNPSFKDKLMMHESSPPAGEPVHRPESKSLERTSLEKSQAQANSSSEHASTSSFKPSASTAPPPADASCTVECGSAQKAKSKETALVGIPKPKPKEAIKGPKPNAGLCSKRSTSLGVEPKQGSQKCWRMSTPSESISTSCSGIFDVPDTSGNSWVPSKAAEAVSSSARNSDGWVSDNQHSWPDPGLSAAPDVYTMAPPDRLINGGIAGSAYGNDAALSEEDALLCVEAGLAFKGVLRVNPHYRNEAYVPLQGVPVDVLIDGLEAQNRAMEGDVVVLQLTPALHWPRMKGANNINNTNKPSVGSSGVNSHFRVANSTQTEARRSLADDTVLEREPSSPSEASVVGLWDSSAEGKDERLMSEGGSPGLFLETSYPRSDVGFWNDPIRSKRGSSEPETDGKSSCHANGLKESPSNGTQKDASGAALASLAAEVQSMPGKRPCGKVLAIVGKSKRREAVVGFLEVQRSGCGGKGNGVGPEWMPPPQQKACRKQAGKEAALGMVTLVPVDNRFSKMVVSGSSVPEQLSRRIKDNDPTVPTELVAARVEEWRADCALPLVSLIKCLGAGGTIEAQTEAILCENAIHGADFPASCLACLPKVPWTIPEKELKDRRDFRGLRVFSIDPPTARDLDDALSFEQLHGGDMRIGVHIADVSYFVRPDTALDKEAQRRSTNVYLVQKVLPMLPPLLCEELCSLNSGVDRLAFSVVWTMDSAGNILDQWIGRAIIRSCAKLTYGQVQGMIDDAILCAADRKCQEKEALAGDGAGYPLLHGNHSWEEIKADVLQLHAVAKRRRELRYDGGALKLENSKLVFSLNEDGEPYDSAIYKCQDSNFLVEEFTLLANMTVAKVISSAFPDRSLLRRHPEPNVRKLKEFEEFCAKKGFDIDTSSSKALYLSLENLRENCEDPVMLNILMLYATKSMQLAKYFCTGEFKDSEEDWAHYALAVPLYTHFTSPIRRYPDLVVHRTVSAALEAESVLSKRHRWPGKDESDPQPFQLFTGTMTDKDAHGTDLAQKALLAAAERHKIPALSELSLVASHCNERRLASTNVKEASDKLYLWSMLKTKQGMLSSARVLALGPKFMSIYVCKIALERRIYYDEIDGLNTEWFEATGTLVLTISPEKAGQKKYAQVKGRPKRTIADVAVLVNPTDTNLSNSEEETFEDLMREVEDRLAGKLVSEDEANEANQASGRDVEVEAAVLPLTLRWLSSVPVFVHATGGESRPLEIGVRLYVSSYAT